MKNILIFVASILLAIGVSYLVSWSASIDSSSYPIVILRGCLIVLAIVVALYHGISREFSTNE
tara:strand:+ start:840 stop:1028 length:189 start_codon:yes stop_codon:yes gene_type:complete